jgi:hypothetical protein
VLLRRKLAVLLASAMLLATVAPSVNAAPKKPPPENFGGSVNSLQHRNNASGKGNFGQCHRTGLLRFLGEDASDLIADEIEGKESRVFNPSPQNVGEADCRQAGTWFGAGAAYCIGPGQEAFAETQFDFSTWPNINTDQGGGCFGPF